MIHFILDKSKNYSVVQYSLLQAIGSFLAPGSFTSAIEKRHPVFLNFALFIRKPADVVMSHGVADKNYFTDIFDDDGELYANRLKSIFVPGPWLKRKLEVFPGLRVPADRIRVVGWPRLDLLRAIQKKRPTPKSSRPRVLWAPTHDARKRGDEQLSTSSYPDFERFLPELERHFEVSVSVHPRNRDEKTPTDTALLDADYVISDFGTLVYEAWALGKPVIFPRWLLGDRIQQYLPGSAEAQLFEQNIGYHPQSIEELIETLHQKPVVSREVDAFMTDYLDNYREGCASQRVAEELKKLAILAR
jgi:CDP-Glycerol:Poly(glycerophosphate) glycerophosphotransferase